MGFRHLLGLPQIQSIDDGTHDIFSEFASQTAFTRTSESEAIEMREVSSDRIIIMSHTLCRPNTR